jgi:protein-disulfide isomerase
MRDDTHNDSDNSTPCNPHHNAAAGVAQPHAPGVAPGARGEWLSPLLIALLGAMALGLVFFLAPLMARGRAGWGQQSGATQTGGAPAGSSQNDSAAGGSGQTGKPGDLPLGPRQEVALGDAPVRGSRTAPVIIVEFADYQCPYCQQMHPELKILQQELAGKVAVAFKDFPLAMHANAEKAAEAARCAGEQGKYWDFHDALFYNGENLEVAQIKQYAHNLKLNQANFDACLDSGKEAAAVQKDMAQGRQLGVRATPSFFFNGRLFTGAMDYYTLRSLVEMLLKTDAPAAAAVRGAAWRSAPAYYVGNDIGASVTDENVRNKVLHGVLLGVLKGGDVMLGYAGRLDAAQIAALAYLHTLYPGVVG